MLNMANPDKGNKCGRITGQLLIIRGRAKGVNIKNAPNQRNKFMATGATSGIKLRAKIALIAQNKLVISKPKKAIHNRRLLVGAMLADALIVKIFSKGLFNERFFHTNGLMPQMT